MAKRRKARKTARKTTRRKKAKRKGSRRKSGLSTTTCALSPELQAIVGSGRKTRPQIVKSLWAYIKSHRCQNAKNRRLIEPDSKLSKVLGSRPIDMLKIAGCLNKHIKK